MEKEIDSIQSTSSGKIIPIKAQSTRIAYEHQIKAMQCLDKINHNDSFSTMVVLPTGGGKTYTASVWLLKNAIDKKKKVLWLAHRQMLLDQALDSFRNQAYFSNLPHISSFKFRIISGSEKHGRTIEIQPDDQLIIASKDSIGRNLSCLHNWLKDDNELYFVIDEAHHSIAKTYRKIIDHVKELVPNLKLIGLTATPFRTSPKEEGLLAKIYSDGVDMKKNDAVYGDLGMAYAINLKELIKRQILSTPVFEHYYTEESFGDDLSIDDWNKIQHFDTIPESIAKKMIASAGRNDLIVKTYKEKQQEYGQTLVFAVNISHAIQLNALFNKAGIKSDFIVSSIHDSELLINLSKENEKKIQAYREGKLQVLINVNILTEGIDLPQTQTVFLARPTVSSILMTQMVGRALRGVKAGGTSKAYIVSFIDNWNKYIAWVNPESLFEGSNNFFDDDNDIEREKRDLMLISVAKLEEFALILSGMGEQVENVPFIERIPLGMYTFTYTENNGSGSDIDHSCQVMVYNSTEKGYKDFINYLPELFKKYNCDEEILPDDILYSMEAECHDKFFASETIPPYEEEDILNILRYYAQYSTVPQFYSFDYIDKNRLDVAKIALTIREKDMRESEREEYLNNLWDSKEDNLLKLYFTNRIFFDRMVDVELMKLRNKIPAPEIVWDPKPIENCTLSEIAKIRPEYEQYLRNITFEKSKNAAGEYQCAICGLTDKTRKVFQVDHIIPMNKGGKTVPENLQILCRKCNGTKGDR